MDLHAHLEALHANSFAWAVTCCGGDREDGADALQAAYEKICAGKARFEGGSSFRTWLFGVIRWTAMEGARRKARREELPLRLAAEPEPETWSEDTFDGEQIDVALRELSPQQRHVIHLVFYEGMTVQEAAGCMGIGTGSARQHYARAKEKLREALAPIFTKS
jgi:RNA polymerase sigma-70 factor (ECF subfamily)